MVEWSDAGFWPEAIDSFSKYEFTISFAFGKQ